MWETLSGNAELSVSGWSCILVVYKYVFFLFFFFWQDYTNVPFRQLPETRVIEFTVQAVLLAGEGKG